MIFIAGLSIMARKDFSRATSPMLVGIPRDLEDRELDQIEEIFLDFPVRMEVLDITRTRRCKRRLFDAEIPELRLKLDQLREVRYELGLPRMTKLNRGVYQATGNRKRRQRLKRDLDHLKSR